VLLLVWAVVAGSLPLFSSACPLPLGPWQLRVPAGAAATVAETAARWVALVAGCGWTRQPAVAWVWLGRRVFLSSFFIQGRKPSLLWTCDGGAIDVTLFLKALHFDHHRVIDVFFGACASWNLVDAWRRILQCEVGVAAPRTCLNNDDTRRAPFHYRLGHAEGLHPLRARCGFVIGSWSYSCLSLTTMTGYDHVL
jgi:hypothetical protein